MTAKDFLNKHFNDSIPSDFNGEVWDDRLIEVMNQYTLSIVEKVVGYEKRRAENSCSNAWNLRRTVGRLDNILTRIKNEIGE